MNDVPFEKREGKSELDFRLIEVRPVNTADVIQVKVGLLGSHCSTCTCFQSNKG